MWHIQIFFSYRNKAINASSTINIRWAYHNKRELNNSFAASIVNFATLSFMISYLMDLHS